MCWRTAFVTPFHLNIYALNVGQNKQRTKSHAENSACNGHSHFKTHKKIKKIKKCLHAEETML